MGLLADQVFGARAFLDAFGVTGYRPWLVAARRLMDLVLERHMGGDGGLTDIPDGGRGETAFLRHARTTVEDLPEPSANAFAAIMLDRLWALTGERHYREASLGILDAFAGVAPRFGPYAAYYGLALHHHMHPAPTVVVVGRLDDPLAKALRQEAWATFRPGRQVAPYAPQDAPYPLGPAGQPRAYVCAGGVCGEPTDDPKALAEAIRSHKA
jgi:uncharacterized protein YyaL (SSP411 family)